MLFVVCVLFHLRMRRKLQPGTKLLETAQELLFQRARTLEEVRQKRLGKLRGCLSCSSCSNFKIRCLLLILGYYAFVWDPNLGKLRKTCS
jgi:hypothetical protein